MERDLTALRQAGWRVAAHHDETEGTTWALHHLDGRLMQTTAPTDTEALAQLRRRAGLAPSSTPLEDDGPWTPGIDRDGESYLQSEDFTHDVRLKISGDFGTADDRRRYAANLAADMNTLRRPDIA